MYCFCYTDKYIDRIAKRKAGNFEELYMVTKCNNIFFIIYFLTIFGYFLVIQLPRLQETVFFT